MEDNLSGEKLYGAESLLQPIVRVQNLLPGAPYLVTIVSANKKVNRNIFICICIMYIKLHLTQVELIKGR